MADYYGLNSETFVFKSMSFEAVMQEQARSASIEAFLVQNNISPEFRVSRPLATYPHYSGGMDKVTAARHYVRGRSLFGAAGQLDVTELTILLARVARFLGLINRSEAGQPQSFARRDLKEKEFGRWLKRIGVPDANAIFDVWWQFAGASDLVRRRDAHLHNWLIEADDAIVAIDLEAKGWRPAGYELAQVTDDHDFLAANDWESRRRIFDEYRVGRGVHDGEELEWRAYQAAILARLVWSLTSPDPTLFVSGVVERRLHSYVESVPCLELRNIGSVVLKAWLSRRGLTAVVEDVPQTRGAGRVRVSKAMALDRKSVV